MGWLKAGADHSQWWYRKGGGDKEGGARDMDRDVEHWMCPQLVPSGWVMDNFLSASFTRFLPRNKCLHQPKTQDVRFPPASSIAVYLPLWKCAEVRSMSIPCIPVCFALAWMQAEEKIPHFPGYLPVQSGHLTILGQIQCWLTGLSQ